MPPRCSICSDPAKREIVDAALLGGASFRDVARQVGSTKDSVARHRDHIAPRLVRAVEASEDILAGNLFDRLRRLHGETLAILAEARSAREPELALKAIARAEGQLRLEGELLGELQQGASINVVLAPEWLVLRGKILVALAPFPEARAAVAGALGDGS